MAYFAESHKTHFNDTFPRLSTAFKGVTSSSELFWNMLHFSSIAQVHIIVNQLHHMMVILFLEMTWK